MSTINRQRRQPQPPPAVPRRPSAELRHLAHVRLENLFDQAEAHALTGTVGVEVMFEAGIPRIVRRRCVAASE